MLGMDRGATRIEGQMIIGNRGTEVTNVVGRGEDIAATRVVVLEKHGITGVFYSLEHGKCSDLLWMLTFEYSQASDNVDCSRYRLISKLEHGDNSGDRYGTSLLPGLICVMVYLDAKRSCVEDASRRQHVYQH